MLEQAAAMHDHHSVWAMITGSGPVVQAVLYILIIQSIWCWAITIQKTLQFRKAKEASDAFTDIFWETKNFQKIDDSSRRLDSSPIARVFASGYRELMHVAQDIERTGRKSDLDLDSVERALRRAGVDELSRLEHGVTFLATTASAAPFIGLFGTVWGIMQAFMGLSDARNSTLQAVAPGISEALIATAIGLAAAIPAAIAYNYCSVMIRRFRASMDSFSIEFLNVAKKSFPR